jgi:hypothetical protein
MGITLCPILAVPKQVDYKSPKEIAFVTDLKKGCAKNTIAPLLFIASVSAASIRIMHIAEEELLTAEQESNKTLLELCLKGVTHGYHWIQDLTHKATVINTFLEDLKIDIFAMVQHKRSFLERLVREPVIKDISMYADIPFLILPEQD